MDHTAIFNAPLLLPVFTLAIVMYGLLGRGSAKA